MFKKIHLSLLFSFLFFGSLANAGDGLCGLNKCSAPTLSPHLINLYLKPTIENNGDLLASLQMEYGRYFVDDLVGKSPLLAQKPEGKFDADTLEWIKDISFKETFSPGMKYMLSPFITSENNFGANFFLNQLIPRLYPLFKTRPIFLSEKQLKAMEELFVADRYEMPREYFSKHFLISDDSALIIIKKIHNEIFIKKNYIMKSDISKISNHTIQILGHGVPASEFIVDDSIKIHYSIVVKILRMIGIPTDVDIELITCNAAVGINKQNTEKTKSELIELFRNKKIKDLAGDMKNSYAYKFSKEIYSSLPKFTGSVIAYVGLVYPTSFSAFMRNPKNPNEIITRKIPMTSVPDLNDKGVFFDKTEMTVEYKRRDFTTH